MEGHPIYLDYNATTHLHPQVIQEMKPYLESTLLHGNPSSGHWFGREAKKAVEQARGRVAAMLKATPGEITFTSGGTEANNLAIMGTIRQCRKRGSEYKDLHVITSEVEHPAVLEVIRILEDLGVATTILPVDSLGLVSVTDLHQALCKNTILVTIMHANNEVGSIQPIAELAAVVHKYDEKILFHTDAAQSIGKVECLPHLLGCDLLSVCSHKFYGPKGVGALYVKKGVEIQRMMHGASHEMGMRAGTENVLEIVGLGAAAQLVTSDLEERIANMALTRDLLYKHICERLGNDLVEHCTRVNGPLGNPAAMLPNTLSICFRGVEADGLLGVIQDEVACSAGAACHTDTVDVSHVLRAMKVPVEYAMGTIRLSTGYGTTEDEVLAVAKIIVKAVKPLLVKPEDEEPVEKEDALPDADSVKLTRYTHGLGCACKLRPQALERVLAALPKVHSPSDANVLVGFQHKDDASVVKLTEDIAIVHTVDFFTPVCDDAYTFGAIAAANALSDIYAMGSVPLSAVSIVGFPSNRLPEETLTRTLQGAQDTCVKAGLQITGGHTVDDTEPKYGLSVTGVVHPKEIWRNRGLSFGDDIILTKPLGTGIASTAEKRHLCPESLKTTSLNTMMELNKWAAESLRKEGGVVACTDITGFGLIGHCLEMVEGTNLDIALQAWKIPVMEGIVELIEQYPETVPGGTKNNDQFTKSKCTYEYRGPQKADAQHEALEGSSLQSVRTVLNDAQTSGGLLAVVSSKKLLQTVNAVTRAAEDNSLDATRYTCHVGFVKKGSGRVTVYY